MEVNELRAERLARAHDPLALMANSNNPYNYPVFHQDQPSPVTYMQQPQPNNNFIPQPSFNMNYMKQPMPNPEDITDPTTAMTMALVPMAKAFKLNYPTPTNNNQRISSNPHNRQIAQPECRESGCSKCSSECRCLECQNGLIVVSGIANPNVNQNGNGNVIAERAEGNGNGNNENQIRCYNYRGLGHLARNCKDRPRRRDASYLQAQLLIAQKEEQASTSVTQTNNAPVYDSDGSAEKKFKSDFKIREVKLLDKLIQLENKINELDNILVKTGQSIQTMHMLSPKADSFYHTELKMALGYQNPFYLKQAQQKQLSLYNGKVLLENHDPPAVYDSEETLQLAQESR
ncbi:integrase, catalytic region, zinc finger, CCHC-type containing protein [Tanacetum coccineum]